MCVCVCVCVCVSLSFSLSLPLSRRSLESSGTAWASPLWLDLQKYAGPNVDTYIEMDYILYSQVMLRNSDSKDLAPSPCFCEHGPTDSSSNDDKGGVEVGPGLDTTAPRCTSRRVARSPQTCGAEATQCRRVCPA